MSKQLPAIQSNKLSADEIQLLRNTYCKGLDDTQISLFLKQADAMDLNPFMNEIYGMVVSGRLQLITSINGLRKVAHKSGSYLGCKVDVTMDDSVALPYSAKAVVKKLVQGHVAEFEAEVLFSEYNTGQSTWKKMPVTMIKKVAEAHALRIAGLTFDIYEESEVGAMQRPRGKSEKAQALTQKFQAKDGPEDVPEHPDIEYLPEPAFDPGEYVIKTGSPKIRGKKVKDIPPGELMEFVKWCYGQEKLTAEIQEYLHNAEKFLESMGSPVTP